MRGGGSGRCRLVSEAGVQGEQQGLEVGAIHVPIVVEVALVPDAGLVQAEQQDLEVGAVGLAVEIGVAVEGIGELDGVGQIIDAVSVS